MWGGHSLEIGGSRLATWSRPSRSRSRLNLRRVPAKAVGRRFGARTGCHIHARVAVKWAMSAVGRSGQQLRAIFVAGCGKAVPDNWSV